MALTLGVFSSLAAAQALDLKLAPSLGPAVSSPADVDRPLAAAAPVSLHLETALRPGRPDDSPRRSFRPLPQQLQELIVSVKVNGVDRGDVDAYMTATREFLIPLATLSSWVRIPSDAPRSERNGETLIFLSDVPGVRVAFDEDALELKVVFPAAWFPPQSFRYQGGQHAPVTASRDLSALLTYTVGGSATRHGGTQWNVTAESDFAYRGWVLRNQYMHLDAGDQSTSLRGLTQWVRDDPRRLTRFIAGDFFTTPTALTGGTILGGLSYSRSFDLDPYFVRQPTAGFSGFADLPSDVSFYVGNNRVYEQRVAPGPFDIGNVNYITGQRDVRIVVRDMTGRERTILFPFYFSDESLARGLQDFSYQVGAIRENAATRNADYGQPAFSATHRLGLTDALTAGFHTEGTKDVLNGGPALTLRSDRLGVASLAFLASHDRSSRASGHALSAQYTYQKDGFSALLGTHRASREFSFLRPAEASGLALRDDFVSLSYGEQRFGTVSLAYRSLKPLEEAPSRDVSLSYSIAFGQKWNLQATYRKTRGFGAGSEVDLGVQYLPRRDLVTTTSLQSTDAGARTESFDFGNILPEGEGLGYHVAVNRSTGPSGTFETLSPGIIYRMRQGELQLYGTSSSSGTVDTSTVNATWGGSIAYVGGRIGLSRPMGDAFAVVQIDPPLAGVRVYLNSQTLGKTDAAGRLFLPRLVSYVENHVGIEDKDIPINYALASRNQVIVPQPSSGYVLLFKIRKVMAVSGTLRYRRAGRGIALNSVFFTVDVNGKPLELATGSNGDFYFENVPAGAYPAHLEIEGRPCRFTLSIPESDEPVVNLPHVQTCDIP